MAVNKLIYETGSGGSIRSVDNDFEMDEGIYTDVYLKLFGATKPYWGNDIFGLNFNSKTLNAIRDNSTDEKGIEAMKRAIKSDLSKIDYAEFTIDIKTKNNKQIIITIDADNNGVLQIAWDFTESQLIEYKTI